MALRKKMLAEKAQGAQSLESMVVSGAEGAYEALQLYRSRTIKAKNKGDINTALKTIVEGCKVLLKHNYHQSGVETSSLFIDILNECISEITPEIRYMIQEIDDQYPKTLFGRLEFLRGCVKWSIKATGRELGDPLLNLQIAACLGDIAGSGKFDKSSIYHFAAGEGPSHLCSKIMESYPNEKDQLERDRLLTLGVCHFLGVENLRDANELFTLYHKSHKIKGWNSKDSELVTFVKYLLLVCTRDAAPLFKLLVHTYSAHLTFDENVQSLLTGPVGLRMFNIQGRPNVLSMLSSMLN